MKMWNLFPKGMFLENLMTVAKRELAWEVDYLREAECTKKFKAILTGYEGFYVPYVVGKVGNIKNSLKLHKSYYRFIDNKTSIYYRTFGWCSGRSVFRHGTRTSANNRGTRDGVMFNGNSTFLLHAN